LDSYPIHQSELLVGDNPGQPGIWVSPAPVTVTMTVTATIEATEVIQWRVKKEVNKH
jgi:multidrug efflux pump subunit AcrA (membrane-fusion protein)